jgi:hypothetical protein
MVSDFFLLLTDLLLAMAEVAVGYVYGLVGFIAGVSLLIVIGLRLHRRFPR